MNVEFIRNYITQASTGSFYNRILLICFNWLDTTNNPCTVYYTSLCNPPTRFKGKTLEGGKVDFTERISRRSRTGYDARSGEWELVGGEGKHETVLQKYRRLQCEMQELFEEVEKARKEVKGECEEAGCLVTGEQVEQALKKLSDLRLEEALGAEVVSSIMDPEGAQLK